MSLQMFHLATNAVRIDDTHYGALFHGRIVGPAPLYHVKFFIFPYLFEHKHPWRITAIGNTPMTMPVPEGHYVDEHSMIYACGLKYVDGRLVVLYSVDDQTASFFVTSVEDVFANMDQVQL